MPDSPLNPPIEPGGSGSAKWTPGPWRVGTHHQILSTGGDNRSAGIASYNSWMGREQAEANANLIAAVPDLYEALDALWDAVAKYDRIGFEGSNLLEVMADARAALLKANPLRKSDHEYGPHAGGPPHAV